MENFNVDFLNRQADPNDLGAIVQRQGSLLQQVGQGFVRVQSLDEIATEIGALQFKAVDPSGQLRMIMSAINLFDAYGIDAHLAGFDANGVPQIWLSADDGSLKAGAGNVVIDSSGITIHNLTDSADPFIIFRSADNTAIGQIYTTTQGNLSLDTYGYDAGDDRKLVLRAQRDGGAVNIATIEIIANTNLDGTVDTILLSADDVIVGEGGTGKTTIKINSAFNRAEIRSGTAAIHIFETDAGEKVYINQTKIDLDFVVSGDTDTNNLFSDASTDRVGIGTDTPAEKLDVVGNIKASGAITGTNTSAYVTNANDIFRCNGCGASGWTGTINGAPAGAVVTYTDVSGNKNTLVPTATTQLGKQRLYNTTRGTSALISTSNGTSTITLTANAPGAWASGDTITTISPTVVSGVNHVDIELTSGDLMGKSGAELETYIIDSGAAGIILYMHPFQAYAASANRQRFTQVAGVYMASIVAMPIVTNVISVAWQASGAATVNVIIRE